MFLHSELIGNKITRFIVPYLNLFVKKKRKIMFFMNGYHQNHFVFSCAGKDGVRCLRSQKKQPRRNGEAGSIGSSRYQKAKADARYFTAVAGQGRQYALQHDFNSLIYIECPPSLCRNYVDCLSASLAICVSRSASRVGSGIWLSLSVSRSANAHAVSRDT